MSRYRALQLRNHLAHGVNVRFGSIAVHRIAELDRDPAVPEPANVHIDLAVIDFLEFGFERAHAFKGQYGAADRL